MKTSMVISFVGDDKPGLIELLSKLVRQHDGNWLESRMTRLAGKFAGILRVDIPAAGANTFAQALQDLDALGVQLSVESSSHAASQSSGSRYRLEIIGHDRPGIVQEVASALASRMINVLEFDTEMTSAPMSAEPLFQANADIEAPAQLDMASLEEHLTKIADQLCLEYTLEPA